MNITQKNHINQLYGVYGDLLTARQQHLMRLYFEEDLSVVEISELETISRQAVSDNIHRTIETLEHYESVLHVYRNFEGRQDNEQDLLNYAQTNYPKDQHLIVKIKALIQSEIIN